MIRDHVRRSAGLFAAIAFAIATLQSQHRKTPGEDYSDKTVSVPEFAIAIKLSPQADKRLQELHESIEVLAMFDGDPLPGQGHFNAPMRDVYLGSDERLADENHTVRFTSTKISRRHWDQLADKNYYLTLNVFSARKSYKNNLLDCGVPEDHIDAFAGKTVEVQCRLIGEPEAAAK